jgi:uncharacterized protein YbbC (DUF1343 family)
MDDAPRGGTEDSPPGGPVRNGIDLLLEDEFSALRDMRVGLVTNHTGITLDGERTIDVLHTAETLHFDRIFVPEHGLTGNKPGGEAVDDARDEATNLPVYGLYGVRDRPDEAQLQGLDALLFDLQDVGCRFYTFAATLGYVLEACAEARVRVFVLDRPNPINGNDIEGPCSDAELESIVNYHPMPLRHGMTIGELARFFNGEREIGADLRVATMAGWQRDLWFDQTAQIWIDPSPNIRDLTAATLYPGVGLLEGTNVSVGRGTPTPFHLIGAPWIDAAGLKARLEAAELPGLNYETTSFMPGDARHPYSGTTCAGVKFVVPDRADIAPGALALALIRALRAAHPDAWEFEKLDTLLARTDLLEAIEDDAPELDDLWQPDLDFLEARAKYLLY